MKNLKTIQPVAFIVRKRLLLVLAVAAMTLPAQGIAQSADTAADPPTRVQQFKKSLDAGDVTAMCEILAESDSSGPLQRLHFEKMQSSMLELIKLWQYTSFSYGASKIDDRKTPFKATVQVIASQMKQEVKFTLLKFGSAWYISDIEIYFK